jgi:hypothetical protein
MLRMKNKLIDAIRNHQTVELVYKGLTYTCDPYMIFAGRSGKYYLFGYKISGGYIKEPGPHLFDMILREITSVRPIGRYKPAKLPHNHNPSDRFYRIIYCSCWKNSR